MAKPALSSWRAGRSSNVLTAGCGDRPVRPIPRKSLREWALSDRKECRASNFDWSRANERERASHGNGARRRSGTPGHAPASFAVPELNRSCRRHSVRAAGSDGRYNAERKPGRVRRPRTGNRGNVLYVCERTIAAFRLTPEQYRASSVLVRHRWAATALPTSTSSTGGAADSFRSGEFTSTRPTMTIGWL